MILHENHLFMMTTTFHTTTNHTIAVTTASTYMCIYKFIILIKINKYTFTNAHTQVVWSLGNLTFSSGSCHSEVLREYCLKVESVFQATVLT